jgi:CheY-like chemotaxis protein
VLDFSKVESNTIVIKPGQFNPKELIEEIRDLFAPLASEKALTVEASFAPEMHECLVADADRLRQAVLNLVGNAVKFTEQGTVSIRASEERNEKGLQLKIEVEDTGIGINAEQQTKLFQPFAQADQGGRRRFGGTGLGLVISRRVVEMMGGTIALRSTPNQGSTFTVTIPVEVSREVPANRGPEKIGSPTAHQTLRILVTDDTETIRFILTAMLQKWGHVVHTAPHGQAALEAVQSGTYDVVLMDMQMPVMDGPDAMRAIRALGGERSRVPIIAITADVALDNRDAYLRAGATTLISKPIDWGQLSQALHDCRSAVRTES